MSKETIFKIQEAEEEAARIIRAANEQADAMRQKAKEDGVQLCRTTEQEASAELADVMEQLRIRAEEMTERVMQETREEAEAVASVARLNRKSAEKIVIRGLDAKCR